MRQGNAAEVATGAVVLLVAIGFLGYAVVHTGRSSASGYDLTAKFDSIDGLNLGSDVRIGGVKVGSVLTETLDPKTYQAVVRLTVRDGVGVPKDSSAVVTSDGLLGGKYLAISPGGDAAMLAPDGEITVTQGSVSLESLLGKFIFSMSSKPATGAAPAAAPAAAGTPTPSPPHG